MALCMSLCLLGDLFLLPALLLSTRGRPHHGVTIEPDIPNNRRRGVRVQVEEPLLYVTKDRQTGFGRTENISQEGARVVSREGPPPGGEISLLWLHGRSGSARARVLRVVPREQGVEFAVAFDLAP
jgi:hypothetical protein